MPKSAVLSIWIKGKPIIQGKFCLIGNKPIYIANMTARKLSINGWGYAIAAQVLNAFKAAKIRPQIIYKRVDLSQHYITNRTRFETKSIARNDGDHQQYWLPLNSRNWKFVNGMPEESYGLPVMTIDKWLKSEADKKEPAIIEDFSIPNDTRSRLRDEAIRKGWYQPAHGY